MGIICFFFHQCIIDEYFRYVAPFVIAVFRYDLIRILTLHHLSFSVVFVCSLMIQFIRFRYQLIHRIILFYFDTTIRQSNLDLVSHLIIGIRCLMSLCIRFRCHAPHHIIGLPCDASIRIFA